MVGLLDGLSWGLTATVMVGCFVHGGPPRCDEGLQAFEGQCVPVPTIVFRQCVESFRTASVERDRGEAVAVGGSVRNSGTVQVEHQRRDVEHTEFHGLDEGDTSAIIDECRRQEQVQRQALLEKAQAATREARRSAREAEADAATLSETVARLQTRLEDAARRTEGQEQELDLLRELAEAEHPCEVEAWDACATRATEDHAAGNYAAAHRRYEAACEAGRAQACGNWGLLHEHGLGVPPDLARAVTLYARGCDDDDGEACAHLGVALLSAGESPARARRTLQRACDADVGRGCFALGWHLEERADDQDVEEVLDLYGRACRLDEADACLALGQRLEVGTLGTRDPLAARVAFERACSLGLADGCTAQTRISRLSRNPTAPHRADSP